MGDQGFLPHVWLSRLEGQAMKGASVQRYRKKPIEVEAVQYTGGNNREIEGFVGDQCLYFARAITGEEQNPQLHIRTLEGDMHVSKGDWIIKGVKGEFYPCKPDIFDQTYEPVHDPTMVTVNP